MRTYKYYDSEKLINLLGYDYKIIKLKILYSFSDWVSDGEDIEEKTKYFLTNKNNIKEIGEHEGLWTEIVVTFTDGEKAKLLSENINSQDRNALRIVENNFLSPAFLMEDNYIIVNEDLEKWLLYNNLTEKDFENISIYFNAYATYTYENIPKPIITDGKLSGYYHGDEFKLSEKDIDDALKDIQNVEMRCKIETILKSFKKRYEL